MGDDVLEDIHLGGRRAEAGRAEAGRASLCPGRVARAVEKAGHQQEQAAHQQGPRCAIIRANIRRFRLRLALPAAAAPQPP